MSVLFLSDQLSFEDFYKPKQTIVTKNKAKYALDVIAKDETWGPLLPASIYSAGSELQLYTIHLYEQATGHDLSEYLNEPNESVIHTMDNAELKISRETPVYRLMSLLMAKIRQLKEQHSLPTKIVFEMMGVTASHFALLCEGGSDVSKLSTDKIENFAKFLGIPNISVRFLASQVSVEDFYNENSTKKFSRGVMKALKQISNDKSLPEPPPKKVFKSGMDLKLYTIRLYEEATGTKLIDEGNNLGKLIKKKPKTTPIL
jgi:predicted XRE-type DNA-binding protein